MGREFESLLGHQRKRVVKARFFITTNGQRQITTLLFNCLCDLRGKLDFMDILLYHKRENFLKEEWRRCMMYRKLAIALFILAVCGTGSQQINAAADDYARPEQNMASQWVKSRPEFMGNPAFVIEDENKKADEKPQESLDTSQHILINTAARQLTLFQGVRRIKTYPVACGKAQPDMMTPSGHFEIIEKEINPSWTDPQNPKNVVPAGPNNPLGQRWMRIGGNYGIHGTNAPNSIGHYASHGCVRMHEKDVEDLFSRVKMHTPVDIVYDRVVIQRDDDHTISYYVYPDGYKRQSLDTAYVKKVLHGYGVDTFADEKSIAEKIRKSDGQQTYVGKVYDIILDGKKLDKRAICKDGITYLPVDSLSSALRMEIDFKPEEMLLQSPYGQAPAISKSGELYIKDTDASGLFKVHGELTSDYKYRLTAEH